MFERRVPYVPQMEETECGAACLAMVLAYHGCHAPLALLRDACNVTRDGTTALELVNAAESFGMDPGAFSIDADAFGDVTAPAILHWEMNHFVVFERLRRDGSIAIVDPAAGRRIVAPAELRRAFTGVVLEMSPSERFAPRRKERRTHDRIRALLRRLVPAMLLMAGSGVLLELLAVAYPAGTQVLLDYVIRPRQTAWLVVLLAVLSGAAALGILLNLARDRILFALRARVDVELLAGFAAHLVRLPMRFHQQRAIGDLASRVQDALAVQDATVKGAAAAFDALLIALYATLLVLYHPLLGAIALGVQALRVLVLFRALRSAWTATTAELVARAKVANVIVEAFSNPEATKAFSTEGLYAARYGAALTRLLNVAHEGRMKTEKPLELASFVDAVGYAAILLVGGHAVIDGQITVGVFAAFVATTALLKRPTESVIGAVYQLALVRPTIDRLDDVLDAAPSISGGVVLDHPIGEIELDHVSFRYGPKAPLLLDDVSLRIRRGEHVAIVGPSGCGKSTLLRLVLGLLEPTAGTIRIDGVDLRTLDREALRRRIGVVLADGYLFDGTVQENLTLGCEGAVPAAVLEQAMAWAEIDRVVAALPNGIMTPLDGNGRTLSGGQRQRLALARALARRPSMLALDEATSSLDEDLDERIHRTIGRLGLTTVSVSHRRSSWRHADRLVVLERGKVVEEARPALRSDS